MNQKFSSLPLIAFVVFQALSATSFAAACYNGASSRPGEDECTRLNGLGGQTEYVMNMTGTRGIYKDYEWSCNANYPYRYVTHYGKCEEVKTVADPRRDNDPAEKPAKSCGSVVSVESRTLGEVIPLVGVPYELWYSSDRVLGRAAAFQIDIPVIGASIPSGMTGATVSVVIAGRTFTQSYTTANSTYRFVWDGKDAANNQINFATAEITVTHQYPVYSGDSPSRFTIPLGIPNLSIGLGNWGLSQVHFYEPSYGTLYLGDGSVRKVKASPISPSGFRVASADTSEVYLFDSSGYHVQTLNGRSGGVTLTITYDSAHRITSLSDAFGNLTTVQRDLTGTATAIVGPYGQSTGLVFDSNSQLTKVTDPNAQTYVMTYFGGAGLLQTFKKPSGEISTITYDATKKTLATDVSSAGNSLSYSDSYIIQGVQERHKVSETSAMGRVKSTSTINSDSYFETILTTPDNRSLTSISLPIRAATNGAEQIYEDAINFVSAKNLVPDIRFGMQSKFDADGNISNGQQLSYSGVQNLTPARTDSATRESMADPFAYTSLQTNSTVNGKQTTSHYTKATGETVTTSPEGRISRNKTNAQGQLTQSGRASFSPTFYYYDSRGRLSSAAQKDRSSTIVYNSNGLVSSVTKSGAGVTAFTYDNANRPLTTTLPDSRVINYSYDAAGNVTSITPPNLLVNSFTYNLMGFATKYTPPDISYTTYTTYAYNNDRQLKQIQRGSGAFINFNYGATTGVLNSITSGSSTFAFTYNSAGQLSSLTSPDGVVSAYAYSGRLLSSQNSSGTGAGQLILTYNNFFNPASVQIGSGSIYNYAYDGDQLLTQTGDETLVRNPATGLVTSTSLGGNVTESYTYDSSYGEVSGYQAKYAGANQLQETYVRDLSGRITDKTVKVGSGSVDTYHYTYDAAGRLTDVSLNGSPKSHYEYDANSNRTVAVEDGVTTIATFDNQDRQQTFGNLIYGYNGNGDVSSKFDNATYATTNYIWDAFGNMKRAMLPRSVDFYYKYDGQNRRVTKLDKSQTVIERYVYLDQTRLAAVLDASGATLITYVWGERSSPEYMLKNGIKYKLVVDQVGSIRQVINSSSGSIAQEIVYDSFGKMISNTDPSFQVLGYAGGLYDKDTKLTQFGARLYDAEIGRWMSKDPILFAGGDTNLYGYVLNDPVNFIDITGASASNPNPLGGGGAPGSTGGSGFGPASGLGEGRAGEAKAACEVAAEGPIRGYTRHGLNQAISRDGGRGVSPQAINEAVRNPFSVQSGNNGTTIYTGPNATVILNSNGQVVTTFPMSGSGVRNP